MRSMTRISRLILLLACITPTPVELLGQEVAREYQMKAAFLLNFAKLVTWPEDPTGHRSVCLLGASPLSEALSSIEGRPASGRTIQTRRIESASEVDGCHVLFLALPDKDVDAVLTTLSGRSILTVGDGESFAERGGAIGLTTWRNRIRIELNIDIVEEAGLSVSSQLLHLARVVDNTVKSDGL